MASLVFKRCVRVLLSVGALGACSEKGGIAANAVMTTPPAMSAAGAGAISSASGGTTAPVNAAAGMTGTTTGNPIAGSPATAAAGGGGSGGGVATGPVTFKMVFDDIIVETGCASGGACHLGMAAGKLQMVDEDSTYMSLVGTTAMGTSMLGNCADAMIMRVKPGDPDDSLLLQKLQGIQKCGASMPPGGKLTDEQLKLVHDWIQMGAIK